MAKEYLDKAGLTYFWGKLKDYFQVKLVSGTNIKTINNESLLGSGNISISGGSATGDDYIVEVGRVEDSGGNGYWRWREWNSGKVEIWFRGSLTLNSTTSQAGGLYRREKWFNFPNSYVLYKCSVFVNGMTGGGWCGCGGIQNASSTTTDPLVKFEVMAYQINAAPAVTQPVSIYICGEKNA